MEDIKSFLPDLKLFSGFSFRSSPSENKEKEKEKENNDWLILDDPDKELDDFVVLYNLPKVEQIDLSGSLELEKMEKIAKQFQPHYIFQEEWDQCISLKPLEYKNNQQRVWDGINIPEDYLVAKLGLKWVIRKGIPDELRGFIWTTLTDANHPKQNYVTLLESVFGKKVPQSTEKPPLFGLTSIPTTHHLTQEGIEACKRILIVVGQYNPSLIYCPSVVIITCILLHYLSEESTFYVVQKLVDLSISEEYYFPTTLKGVSVLTSIINELIEIHLPNLWNHIVNIGLVNCTEWSNAMLNMFFTILPYHTSLRVFDIFINEGRSILYRVMLAILSITNSKYNLLQIQNAENFLNLVIQSAYQIIDEKKLITQALSFQLKSFDDIQKKHEQNAAFNVYDELFFTYYRPKISEPSLLFDDRQLEAICSWLPIPVCMKDPALIFRLSTDGYSLRTFYNKVSPHIQSLIIMKTKEGNIFGAYLDAIWEVPTDGFVGSKDSFVFTLSPQPQKYPYQSDSPDHILFVEKECFHIGMSNTGPSISVMEDWEGKSVNSNIFSNPPLNNSEQPFVIVEAEAYCFV